MDLAERIYRLENKMLHQKEALRKMVLHIKGKDMSEFDFDALLDEIDEDVVAPDKVEIPVENAMDELDDLLSGGEIVVDGGVAGNAGRVIETDETDETDETANEVVTNISVATEAKIQQLQDTIENLKDDLKAAKKFQAGEALDQVISTYEYSNEAKSFLKDFDSLEFDKRAIQEKIKDLKEEYKDQGVDIAAALKARNEVIKELKEDSETSVIIESMKEAIKGDETLMTNATVFAG